MDSRVYGIVYGCLVSGCDLDGLAVSYGVELDTLKAILHQKIVRETMHNHHKIQTKTSQLKKQWEQGDSIINISKKINFPPVMTAWMILNAKGVPRSQFRAMVRKPEALLDTRLRRELSAAVKKDAVYSPEATKKQMERSRMVEETVRHWLLKRKIAFIDEKEAKEKKHAKTPEFLLKKPMQYGDEKIHWVECKASFGDEFEARRDYGKQLKYYVEMYGRGMVVYWYGFLDTLKMKDVRITSSRDII
ncbi:MAG: TPD domain-containing protein [Candidatus Altiarchaeota archaeon]